jgi:hypothetical protein
MKYIQLDKGFVAIVDDEDHEWLSSFKWRAHNPSGKPGGLFYALTGYRGVAMHRMITDCPKGLMVDHINKNSLDNRKLNLRVCTHRQNVCNKKPLISKRSKSKYLGVDLNRSGNRWVARIGVNSKKIHLGTFLTEDDAALIYDMHAKAAFGEFANLNFKKPVYAGTY